MHDQIYKKILFISIRFQLIFCLHVSCLPHVNHVLHACSAHFYCHLKHKVYACCTTNFYKLPVSNISAFSAWYLRVWQHEPRDPSRRAVLLVVPGLVGVVALGALVGARLELNAERDGLAWSMRGAQFCHHSSIIHVLFFLTANRCHVRVIVIDCGEDPAADATNGVAGDGADSYRLEKNALRQRQFSLRK